MEVTEEEESSPIASEGGVGVGKDLLYGWLVGRAAADLGLAQALAFSGAQRGEQIKRLEESLLERVRELQKPEISGDVKASAEVDALKIELQRVSESQRALAADRIHVEQLETLIRGKLREFEDHSQQGSQGGAGSDLGDIKLELKLLVDRIARAEYAVQQVQAHAECQNQRVDEMTAYRLKTQLVAEVANDTSIATVAQSVETNLQEQLAEIRAELGQSTRAAAALGVIQDRLAEISQRLEQIESAPSASAILADHENRWTQELDARMDRLENAALGQTTDLQAELSAIKTRLDDLHAAEPAEDSGLRLLEGSVFARIGELQERLADALSASERRDAALGDFNDRLSALKTQWSEYASRADEYAARSGVLDSRLSEMQGEIDALGERLVHAESGAQETHALLVNEAGLSAQLREEVMSEVSELRGKLAAQRTSDGGLDNLGVALSARIDNLQKQLSRSVAALESRDAELAELKTQVQYLCRKASLKSTVPAPSSHRSPPPMGMTAGLSDVKAPIDSRVPARNSTAGELNCLLQSYEAGVEGSNEQKRQLQQRISADIERARAELRKRAGVSR